MQMRDVLILVVYLILIIELFYGGYLYVDFFIFHVLLVVTEEEVIQRRGAEVKRSRGTPW